MRRTSSDRSGLLILRLWIEANHQRGLRARITQTLDTMTGEQVVAVAASSEDVCAVVKRWVQDFENGGSLDGHGRANRQEGERS